MDSTWVVALSEHLEHYASNIGVNSPHLGLNLGLGVLAIAGVGVYLRAAGRPHHGPGPKGVPILGNLNDLPKQDDYLVYAEWAKKYGKFLAFLSFDSTDPLSFSPCVIGCARK
jgi:hypothetical protein